MTYFNPPRPAYANPPIKPEYYVPNVFDISDITRGMVTVVTTIDTFYGVSNNYVIGQQVRLVIPSFYGIQQINNLTAIVIGIPDTNQVILNIDSRNFDPFIPSPSYGPTSPQILAIGDVNTGVVNTGRSNQQTFIDGSFINVSPR